MRKLLIATLALSAASFGLAVSSANAAPVLGGRAAVSTAPSTVENVRWVRVCNHHGHRCHMVWVRRDHHHHYGRRWF